MADYEELTISTSIYSTTAILHAAYKFTDRCYLFIRPEESNQVVVEFRARENLSDLRELIGLFSNELIDQQLRETIGRETRDVRGLIVARALSDGPANPE